MTIRRLPAQLLCTGTVANLAVGLRLRHFRSKKKLEYNAKNLNDFDAVLLYTGGTLEMDDQQKADFSLLHPRRR
jgi:hypothetical protein